MGRLQLRAVAGLPLLLFLGCGGEESPTETSDPPDPVATTVQLSTGSVSFDALGDSEQVSATVLDQNGRTMASARVTWSSAATSVATVTPAGVIAAAGNGNATVTASSGGASAEVDVLVEQVVTSLSLSPAPLILDAPGDTATVTADTEDANGNSAADATIEWASSDEAVAIVSGAGLVTGVGGGTTLIVATVDAASESIEAFVGGETVTITAVDPPVLIEGEAATITGSGFAATPSLNTVRIDGLDAQVTAASATSLSILVPEADCQPPRLAGLEVATPTEAAATTVHVSPAEVWELALGGGVFKSSKCVHLAAASGAEAYLVGALSVSETPWSVTPVVLGADAASTAPAPQVLVSADEGPGTLRFPTLRTSPPTTGPSAFSLPTSLPDRSGEAEIRRMDQELIERLSRAGVRPTPSSAAAFPRRISPAVGDTVTLNVPASCDSAVAVRAVTQLVGPDAIWLEDADNPTESFTSSEYTTFDQTLTSSTLPVLRSYFGDFEDVDGNGKILVLLTKEVNERENLAGFVQGADLVGQDICPGGNGAEIFYGYVPDPAGVHGRTIAKANILPTYHALIAHETTHVIQLTQALFGGGVFKSSWELEGGATLAEQLVGFTVLGHGPRQDLGRTEWETGEANGWYGDWAYDMTSYFGYLSGGSRAAGAPEQCSWVGRDSEGNSGPCFNGRAVYGVPATLLRYVLDWYGLDHAGGDPGLMRELTSSAFRGFETLERATGDTRDRLLTEFAITLWADGRLANWLPSWDIFDVFSGFPANAQLATYVSTAVEPELSASVRAGSNAYLEWYPPSAHEPTSLRLRTAGGAALPDHIVLWVLRIQ